MANIRKHDYAEICLGIGVSLVSEDNKHLIIEDSLGYTHKTLKSSLVRGCNVGFRSVIDKDRKNYFLSVFKSKYPDDFKDTCFQGFEYLGGLEYTEVRCNIHNQKYRTRPNTLLTRGSHCSLCSIERSSKEKRLTQGGYMSKVKEVHGIRYGYEKTKYKSAREPVTITCREHGDFQLLAYSHIQGSGCQACGLEIGGFSRGDYRGLCPEGSSVYIVKFTGENESYIKIGISKSIKNRVTRLRRVSGCMVEVLHEEFFPNATDAWDMESLLHKEFKRQKVETKTDFKGDTECFSLDVKEEAIKLLNCISC